MKICFCVASFPVVSQTFVTTQVLYAVRLGHDVTVACGEFEHSTPLSPETRDLIARVCIVIWPPQKPPILRAMPTSLADRIAARLDRIAWRRQINADVIIAHFGYRGAAVARAQHRWARRPPLVTVFHGRDVSVEYQRNSMARYRDLFANGDLHLAVNSIFAKKLVECGAPAERVDTHHVGIPVVQYDFSPPAIGGSLRFFSVCRLVEKKGLSIAIDALALLRENHPDIDWCYDIGGAGPLENQLREQSDRAGLLDRVRFLGALSHQDALNRMSQADILLVPSVTASDGDQEGIPVALMEAMALGVSVCATRHSGIPELVTHMETGLLSEEYDAAKLYENIVLLALDNSKATAMATAARLKVEHDYNEDRQNAELLERCRRLCQRISA